MLHTPVIIIIFRHTKLHASCELSINTLNFEMMCFSGQGLRCLEPSNNPGGYAQKGRPKIELKSLISLEYLNNFLLTVTQG